MLRDTLLLIDDWREKSNMERIHLFHNRTRSRASFAPISLLLFPINTEWLESLRRRKWSGRSLPAPTMSSNRLLRILLRQQLFITLFRSFVESLASENAARLAAMQVAESNIEDLLEALTADYHRERQAAGRKHRDGMASSSPLFKVS